MDGGKRHDRRRQTAGNRLLLKRVPLSYELSLLCIISCRTLFVEWVNVKVRKKKEQGCVIYRAFEKERETLEHEFSPLSVVNRWKVSPHRHLKIMLLLTRSFSLCLSHLPIINSLACSF